MAKKKIKKNRRKQPLASGPILHIPMPADLPKMSAVILKVAEPLLSKEGTTPQRIESIIALTIAGWNNTLFPASEQATVEKELIESLVSADGSPDTGAGILHLEPDCGQAGTDVSQAQHDDRGLRMHILGWQTEAERLLDSDSRSALIMTPGVGLRPGDLSLGGPLPSPGGNEAAGSPEGTGRLFVVR
jgi:hypothetical protein